MQRSISLALCALAAVACSKEGKRAEKESPPQVEGPKEEAKEEPVATCTSDDDCVIACDRPGDCCGELCTCERAMHRDERDRVRAQNDHTCPADPDCPVADCPRPEADYEAVCDGGTCVARAVAETGPVSWAGLAGVVRTSPRKGEVGSMPPFDNMNVYFSADRDFRDGEAVTLLSSDPSLPALAGKVSARESHEDLLFNMTVIARPTPEWLEAPGRSGKPAELEDSAILYPAQPRARTVDRSSMTMAAPKGMSWDALVVAIDTDDNGDGDVAVFSFCCKDRVRPAATERCDYTCSGGYAREGDGWKHLQTLTPL